MATSSRGIDALLVVGLSCLGIGILLAFAGFSRMADAMAQPRIAGATDPSMAPMMLGGALATAGLVMLGFWAIGPTARIAARAAAPEIAAAVRDAQAGLACHACSTPNPADAKHCRECGARLA